MSHRSDVSNPTGLDAYKPAAIAELVEQSGVVKAGLPLLPLTVLAVLAGAFIAFGAAFYTGTMTGLETAHGPAKLLGGVAFSLGLILVIIGGAELFTGNALIVIAWVDGRVTGQQLARNWSIVYIGNFVGAIALAGLIASSGLLAGSVGETAARIASAKMELTVSQAFLRGVLCNILVCLAVWLSMAARTVTGKILAIIWPITAFVALGFEHSVANMYMIPVGIIAGAQGGPADLAANLAAVTAGNIVGGAGGVALAYRAAYGGSGRPIA